MPSRAFAISPHERRQFRLEFERPPGHLGTPLRQVEKSVRHHIEGFSLVAENERIGQGTDRKLVLVVGPHGEGAVLELERELPAPQGFAVLLAEHRREQLALTCPFSRPVDVEPSGIARLGAPFEHVEPQRVVGAADSHMVGDKVQQATEALAAKRLDHRSKLRLRPELRI